MYQCTSNFEKEIKTISFRITWKRIIHLGINLTREVQCLYIDYIVEKKFKRLNKLKKISSTGIRRLILLRKQYFQNLSTDSIWSLSKYQCPFFAESPLIIKFIRGWKGSRIAKSCKRTKLEDSHSQFQNLLQICSNKRAWQLH